MPRGDKTGPMGMGSKTGRGAGFCSGFGMPGYANRQAAGFGGGLGRGRAGCANFGGGRGFRHRFYATGVPFGFEQTGAFEPVAEKDALKNRADALQSELDAIKKRLAKIEGQE